MTNADPFQFWGKALPLSDAGPQWHPLVFHCIDVAAVGSQLLQADRSLSERLCKLLDLKDDELARLVPYLLSLHDIGKFAKRFQAKAPSHYPPCLGDSAEAIYYDHAAGGFELFEADCALFGIERRAKRPWRFLLSAVTGHHGAPPQTDPLKRPNVATLRSSFGRAGIEAACQFAADMRVLFDPPTEVVLAPRLGPASFALAGVAVLADWLGSNEEWFPYQSRQAYAMDGGRHAVDLDRYWHEAQKTKATQALKESGVLPAQARERFSFGDLIADAPPSPMQQWAQSVDLPPGPGLFVIEDETGSGKTEAAVMLAHRLMAAGRAQGIYVALPTMATADAMFDRLAAKYRKLFGNGAPSIALTHGAREMHEGFRNAMLRGGRVEPPYSAGDADEETTASSACAAWLAGNQRRSLLADVGVGTVDQALLSILPSRHQSLRLLGLLRKVLILDEVHAYDAYMQREIETLLEFHAGLGGSAILLSATLPETVRRRLGAAFAKGSGHVRTATEPLHNAYPLATVHAGEISTETPVRGRADRARRLPVRFLPGPQEALDEVARGANDGQAVLYIRNSVDDVLDAHAALRERGLRDVDIFHARFALADRLEIEHRIVQTFGKDSTTKQRAGKVLVATQVVEQSLDLDFDAMVSDLAPVDLLIQRAGRLWRHERKGRQGTPELLVVGPEASADAAADWFSKPFPRAAYVYRAHARMWLTAKALQEAGAIDSPAGLRPLIEAVYGDGVEAGVPPSLEAVFWDAEGRESADRGVAKISTLALQPGYMRDGGAWDKDTKMATRIADDPQVTLRLARVRAGHVEPYAERAARERWRAWRLSEVSVARRRISGEAKQSEHVEAAREAKSEWGRYDEDKILILLEEQGSEAVGSAVCGEGGVRPVRVAYGERGLIFLPPSPS